MQSRHLGLGAIQQLINFPLLVSQKLDNLGAFVRLLEAERA
jgi:hypothetical protein